MLLPTYQVCYSSIVYDLFCHCLVHGVSNKQTRICLPKKYVVTLLKVVITSTGFVASVGAGLVMTGLSTHLRHRRRTISWSYPPPPPSPVF
jgi:hypothetical protein